MITAATIGAISFNISNAYGLTGMRGLEMPPIRLASYNLAGQHYGQYVSSFYGKRRFSLEGWVVGTDAADFITKRDALQTALSIMHGPQVMTFTLANGRSLRITAIPTQLDFEPQAGMPTAAEFQAEFEAAFPFLLSTTNQLASLTLPLPGGGTVPATVPMSLSLGSGGSLVLTNGGTAPSFPTARLSGPVTNPAIRNITTGQELRFDLVLASGEYLDIDFINHTIIDNTGRSRYDAKTGDWWALDPGNTEIRFVADSSNPTSTAAITYQDAYLGI